MHLVACAQPQEPLESAPRSALLAESADGADEQWDGFWSASSDDYFVRRTRLNGETQWFRLEDDADSRTPEQREQAEPRVLMLRSAYRARVNVVVAKSPNGQRMLVGSARRVR
jgi:hypothetical protein